MPQSNWPHLFVPFKPPIWARSPISVTTATANPAQQHQKNKEKRLGKVNKRKTGEKPIVALPYNHNYGLSPKNKVAGNYACRVAGNSRFPCLRLYQSWGWECCWLTPGSVGTLGICRCSCSEFFGCRQWEERAGIWCLIDTATYFGLLCYHRISPPYTISYEFHLVRFFDSFIARKTYDLHYQHMLGVCTFLGGIIRNNSNG